MAITIKSIPTLSQQAAKEFVEKAAMASMKGATVNFKKQSDNAKKIVAKSKKDR